MRVINLAHGELLMLGAYTTFWLFARTGLNPILSLLITMPLLFLLGAVIQRYLVGRVVRRPLLISLLMTFGISLFLSGLAQQLWTNDFRSVPYLSGSIDPFGLGPGPLPAPPGGLHRGPGPQRGHLRLPALGALGAGLAGDLPEPGRRPRLRGGRRPRPLDRLRPRRLPRRRRGPLASFMYSVFPQMGQTFMLKAFAVIVLGGLGSFPAPSWGPSCWDWWRPTRLLHHHPDRRGGGLPAPGAGPPPASLRPLRPQRS